MKTVIYLDVLLLVNFLIAYLLLMAVGLLTAQRAGFARMVAASALAALSALILFVPPLPYPAQVSYKVVTAAGICMAAFGVRRLVRYLASVCWYAALNLLLAGLAMLAIFQTGSPLLQTANLTLYLRISPLLLVGLCGGCCLFIGVVLRVMTPVPQTPTTIGLELVLGGAQVRLRAMLDTGCHLKDPVTCLPVLLVSYPDAKARLPEEVCQFLDAWFAGARQLPPPEGTRLRLIPCTTAAQNTLLPGFAVEGMGLISPSGILGLGRTAVAFAPQSFGNQAYEALYGNDFL